jgi:hypothetical protein
MFRCATAAVLAVLASVPLASAADKAEKAKKPTGTWTHTVQDITVTFTFADDTLHCEMTKTDGTSLTADSAYGVTADGLVFGVITKVEKKGTDEGPEKGVLFSFQYTMDKDTLTVSDLNVSTGISDQGRQLLQGEYKRKK